MDDALQDADVATSRCRTRSPLGGTGQYHFGLSWDCYDLCRRHSNFLHNLAAVLVSTLSQAITRHLPDRRRNVSRSQNRSKFLELKIIKLFIITIISIAISTPADADPKRHHVVRHVASQRLVTCDDRGCSDQSRGSNAVPLAADASGNSIIVGRRPPGCPYEFCGCEASLYLFGKSALSSI